jgi:hypothetical protein
MKRLGIFAAGVVLSSIIGGCGGGIDEGPPTDGPTDPQPAGFKDYMKKNAGNMAGPGRGAGKPKSTPLADAPPPAEKKAAP